MCRGPNEAVLDLLSQDDRVSTSHEPAILGTAQALAARAHDWPGRIDGIVYRSRTTPSSTSNLACWAPDVVEAHCRRVRDCAPELDELVLRRDFTIDFRWS